MSKQSSIENEPEINHLPNGDRFALQIFEHSRGYRVEFPNYTTAYCPELVARLLSIVGADNVIVEPLRLH